MTDPRIEAAVDAAWSHTTQFASGETFDQYNKRKPYEGGVFRKSIVSALAAAEAMAWRPMSEAPRDRTDILAKTRPDIYPEAHNRSGWNNRSVVIRHEGIVNDDFDMGWSVSAPVGYGGMPDEWFLGWQPISDFLEGNPKPNPETITIPQVRNDRPIERKGGVDG